jgi:hypothetical protein
MHAAQQLSTLSCILSGLNQLLVTLADVAFDSIVTIHAVVAAINVVCLPLPCDTFLAINHIVQIRLDPSVFHIHHLFSIQSICRSKLSMSYSTGLCIVASATVQMWQCCLNLAGNGMLPCWCVGMHALQGCAKPTLWCSGFRASSACTPTCQHSSMPSPVRFRQHCHTHTWQMQLCASQ